MRQAAVILIAAFACFLLAASLAVWDAHTGKKSSLETLDVLAAKNSEQRGFAPAEAAQEEAAPSIIPQAWRRR